MVYFVAFYFLLSKVWSFQYPPPKKKKKKKKKNPKYNITFNL